MVVQQDEGVSIAGDDRAQDLARMSVGFINRADGYRGGGGVLQAGIDRDDQGRFVRQVVHLVGEMLVDKIR